MITNNFYIPKNVLYIIKTLKDQSYSAYLVGGCIRDLILNRVPNDWDICTSALPNEVEDLFDNTIPTGIKHGTVSINIEDELYEVTTYRYDEVYSDSHIPESVSFDTSNNGIYRDLSRRDFTINSIAYDPIDDIIVDPYNGMTDINNKIIKAVGNAVDRFVEDPLRMLRAIRFSCYLDGFNIDKETFKAIEKERHRILFISAERIYSEIKKMIMSDNVDNIMNLHYSKLDTVIFPEFDKACECTQNHPYHNTSVGKHSVNTVKNCPKDLSIRFAALFHDLGKPLCKVMDYRGDHFYGHPKVSRDIAKEIMKRWKFSNKDTEIISNLVLEHDTLGYIKNNDWGICIKKLLFKYGEDFVDSLIKLSEADLLAHSSIAITRNRDILDNIKMEHNNILYNKEPYSLKDLPVSGEDILSLGYSGKIVGYILTFILIDVIKYPNKNTRDYIMSNIDIYIKNAKNKLRGNNGK